MGVYCLKNHPVDSSCGGCSRLGAISLNIINTITICRTYELRLTSSKNDRDYKEHIVYVYIIMFTISKLFPFTRSAHSVPMSHTLAVYITLLLTCTRLLILRK